MAKVQGKLEAVYVLSRASSRVLGFDTHLTKKSY
jgi:hypothetical protein